MKALEVLFWISLFIVFYTYIGYGILLYILVKIKECFRKPAPRPMPADDALPPLTLFIAAYNEEDVVDEKMHNCLELDYPADKLRILWVTDGSNDIPTNASPTGRKPSSSTNPNAKARQPP